MKKSQPALLRWGTSCFFISFQPRAVEKKNNNTPAPFEASVLRLRALGSSLTLPSLNYVAITGRQRVCVMCVCRPSFHLPPSFVSRLLPASAMVMGPRRGASAVSPPPLIRSICSPRPPPPTTTTTTHLPASDTTTREQARFATSWAVAPLGAGSSLFVYNEAQF